MKVQNGKQIYNKLLSVHGQEARKEKEKLTKKNNSASKVAIIFELTSTRIVDSRKQIDH